MKSDIKTITATAASWFLSPTLRHNCCLMQLLFSEKCCVVTFLAKSICSKWHRLLTLRRFLLASLDAWAGLLIVNKLLLLLLSLLLLLLLLLLFMEVIMLMTDVAATTANVMKPVTENMAEDLSSIVIQSGSGATTVKNRERERNPYYKTLFLIIKKGTPPTFVAKLLTSFLARFSKFD